MSILSMVFAFVDICSITVAHPKAAAVGRFHVLAAALSALALGLCQAAMAETKTGMAEGTITSDFEMLKSLGFEDDFTKLLRILHVRC